MKKGLFAFLFVLPVFTVIAQSDSTKPVSDSIPKPAAAVRKSYFLGTLSYLSNSVYNGRKDSVATPYINGMLGYYHKSGLFIDGTLAYLARPGSSRIDLATLEAGYDFDIGNFDGEFSASKYFYNNQSTNVAAQVSGSVMFSGDYDLVYITPTVEAGLDFGTKADYMFAFGLEHTFYACDDKLQITPSALAGGSTLNYYSSYYNKRKLGGKKKSGGVVYDVTAGVDDPSRFRMLYYQFKLPLLYTIKKVTFNVSPAYVLPVNAAVVTANVKSEATGKTVTRSETENISNTFYVSVGVSLRF